MANQVHRYKANLGLKFCTFSKSNEAEKLIIHHNICTQMVCFSRAVCFDREERQLSLPASVF